MGVPVWLVRIFVVSISHTRNTVAIIKISSLMNMVLRVVIVVVASL
nr:MAG TPA: 4'-phosphopantetheinyl transferase [Bacteriophage sp.]